MLYDIFICHSGEDKEEIVRPLAERLRENHVEVWFDEFTLKPGDSLRRSIDLGLAKSRYGVVVLSQSFFRRGWPQWELDGLVQRQVQVNRSLIIPIWHGIDRNTIAAHSPSLADLVAVRTDKGLDHLVSEILRTVHPEGSTLLIARDRVMQFGYEPPVVTDDWWLDVVEHSASNDVEDTFQEAMGWGRWGFPLPPRDADAPRERGERLAWAALQMLWQREAHKRAITQITHPEKVHEFVRSQPGLLEIATEHPTYLMAYAPQLTIRGLGGPFEEFFEESLKTSVARRKREQRQTKRTSAIVSQKWSRAVCDELIALRHPTFGRFKPSTLACYFVQGELHGPDVKAYEVVDYLAWFLSDVSAWMPRRVHEFLLRGLIDWAMWPWAGIPSETGYDSDPPNGALLEQMYRSRNARTFKMTRDCKNDLVNRLAFSAKLLELPEGGEELGERFISCGATPAWFETKERRRAENKSSTRAHSSPATKV